MPNIASAKKRAKQNISRNIHNSPLRSEYRTMIKKVLGLVAEGKKDEAAKPNANATTPATKPGGFRPARPAATTATAIEILAAHNSPFSEIFGLIFFFNRSCDIDVEITRSRWTSTTVKLPLYG